MEVYTLDALLRRNELFEDFESLIWTERYKQYGDFDLRISSSYRTRSLLVVDTLLALDTSDRVMKIESVEDGTDDNNRRMLIIKGRSLETILYDRVAKESLTASLTTSPKWIISGLTATAAARKIFHDICVTGLLSVYDKIPYIHEGTFTAASNIPEPVDLVRVEIEPTTVYDAILQLAEIWNFGFRLLRRGDTSQLWFDIYTGSDRTSGQSTLPAVVFSPQLDNLQNTKELTTTENAKNVAYVFSSAGNKVVYADGADPAEMVGLERRILVVNASDVTAEDYPTPEALSDILTQRGNEALSKNRTFQAFDGEISQTSQYKPGRDYNIGDLVEMRNTDGVANNMRVTEIIHASDKEGERSYPTLTINQYINTGSWLSWLNNKMWTELGPEEWDDQP